MRSYSPPEKLTSPESQRNLPANQAKDKKIPSYLKKVSSKIKDAVNHHKTLDQIYKKMQSARSERQKFQEELCHRNSSEEDNYKYAEYLSNSIKYMSSEKQPQNFNEESLKFGEQKIEEGNREKKNNNQVLKQRKIDDIDYVKSPTFLNVESQYLEKENELSQFKPKTLEFESNYSSNLNTRYNNNLLMNNNNNNNKYVIEISSDSKKKSENLFNDLGGVKNEQSKYISDSKEIEINKNFKYTGGTSFFFNIIVFNGQKIILMRKILQFQAISLCFNLTRS